MTVYFISYGEGAPIKIGYTSTPVDRRLAGLQTSAPHKLIVLGEMEGTRADEQALHARFDADRMRGEWFRPSAELLALVALHRRPEPVALEPTEEAPKVRNIIMQIEAPYDPEAGDVPWSSLTGRILPKPNDWLQRSHNFDWRHTVTDGKLPTEMAHFE